MFPKQWPTPLTNDVSTIDGPKLSQIDTNVSRAIDGTAGGTYLPTTNIDVKNTNGGALGDIDILGILRLLPGTPTAIAVDPTHDYAGANGMTVARISTNVAGGLVTGIASGTSGRLLILINVGANSLVLAHENAGSLAANRVILDGAANKTMATNAHVALLYDVTTARWRQVA